MDTVLKQGRLLFAIAIAEFGIENLICARTTDPSLPVIPFLPSYPWLACLTGVALLAAAVCIAANIGARLAATLLGILFFIFDLFIQVSRVAASPWDIGIRTCAFEILAIGSLALILAGSLPAEAGVIGPWQRAANVLISSGRYLFGVSAIVFGIDHYLVFGLIVSLVPAWIPGGGWFWANLTAIAFIAAGASIAIHWMDRWAAALLGLMLVLWFLVLHAPRVLSLPRFYNPDEWSSAFIALAIGGGSWVLAWSLRGTES
ncbi:MAG: hypothetical protein ABR907_09475 [Terracidiphilus sp.]|jgi:hypothetical protein